MKMDLATKVAAFCRELGEDTLREVAHKQRKEEVLQRAEDALRAGQIGPELDADLDTLDEMLKEEYGQGLFLVTRGYTPLPSYQADTGAQWWTCPRRWCAGRGRVRPGQQSPMCAATHEQLVPGPLPG